MQDRPGSQGLLMHCPGIVHKQFDPTGGEANRVWAASAVSRRLVREKELSATDGEPRHHVLVA
jgi:hypothetical protein